MTGEAMPDHVVTHYDLEQAIKPIASEIHDIDVTLQTHLRHSDVQDARLQEVIETLPKIGASLRAVEDWKVEMLTYSRLLKATFGASVVAAVISILTLVDLLRHMGT